MAHPFAHAQAEITRTLCVYMYMCIKRQVTSSASSDFLYILLAVEAFTYSFRNTVKLTQFTCPSNEISIVTMTRCISRDFLILLFLVFGFCFPWFRVVKAVNTFCNNQKCKTFKRHLMRLIMYSYVLVCAAVTKTSTMLLNCAG